jgi:hypothetical protein
MERLQQSTLALAMIAVKPPAGRHRVTSPYSSPLPVRLTFTVADRFTVFVCEHE